MLVITGHGSRSERLIQFMGASVHQLAHLVATVVVAIAGRASAFEFRKVGRRYVHMSVSVRGMVML